jgi:hypothetical protein
MFRIFMAAIAIQSVFASVALPDIVITIDNIDVVQGSTNVQIPVYVSGLDSLNAVALAFGLGDGGPVLGGTETAQIISFSLDQTIWDTNPTIGVVSTSALGTPASTPLLPSAATVLDLPGASSTSFVIPNGVLAYFNVDFSSKSLGSKIQLNPNIAGFSDAFSINAVRISTTFNSGTATITAVPEPSSISLFAFILTMIGIPLRRRISPSTSPAAIS